MTARKWSLDMPSGLGAIIAIFVIIFGTLGLVGVLETNLTEWIFGLIVALGVARLT